MAKRKINETKLLALTVGLQEVLEFIEDSIQDEGDANIALPSIKTLSDAIEVLDNL
jgi:hypothetical protein